MNYRMIRMEVAKGVYYELLVLTVLYGTSMPFDEGKKEQKKIAY